MPSISWFLHSRLGLATYWCMCKCCITYLFVPSYEIINSLTQSLLLSSTSVLLLLYFIFIIQTSQRNSANVQRSILSEWTETTSQNKIGLSSHVATACGEENQFRDHTYDTIIIAVQWCIVTFTAQFSIWSGMLDSCSDQILCRFNQRLIWYQNPINTTDSTGDRLLLIRAQIHSCGVIKLNLDNLCFFF